MAIEVDSNCPGASSYKVHLDFNAMLNQTNIGANNNKFYVIQVLEKGGKYFAWNRWGRVGEVGQSALKGPFATPDGAIKEFSAKYKDKTSNSWDDRKNFKPKAGKYTLIEIDTDADSSKKAETEKKLSDLAAAKPAVAAPPQPVFAPSALSPEVQSFVKLIFDKNMFTSAMASYEIDVRKMPLGQLSKAQVQKGFDALDEIEQAMNTNNAAALMTATSRFYTVIPHDFGRRKPPVINAPETLQKKRDMLNVLADIEVALGLEKKAEEKPATELLPNPIDANYATLKCGLEHVDPKSEEFAFISKYIESTKDKNHYYKPQIVDVFRMDRQGENTRFSAHDTIAERKLLWHGTNVAVVAAICGTGLRIMPHSGGRVGRGIYFASENGKSIQYIGPSGDTAVMFLAEVALGKEHSIWQDDSSLRNPPKGFDCIVARGHTEPDPEQDITWTSEGKKVTVPQGSPIKQKQWQKSSFTHSEYLVYSESQVRLRYALRIKIR